MLTSFTLRPAALIPCLLAALAGCDPSPPVEVGEYRAQAAEVSCARYFRCCTQAEIDGLFSMPLPDQAACEAYLNETSEDLDLYEPIEAGRLTWNASAAGACLDALRGTSCDTVGVFGAIPDVCRDITGPAVSLGGACRSTFECIEGHCGERDPADPGGFGTCVPGVDPDLSCGGGPQCGVGEFCDREAGRCEPQRANGEACASALDCESLACEDDVCVARAPSCDGV